MTETSKNRATVDLAELTERLGLPAHEQSAVASWTGEAYGTTWTEPEALELERCWRQLKDLNA